MKIRRILCKLGLHQFVSQARIKKGQLEFFQMCRFCRREAQSR